MINTIMIISFTVLVMLLKIHQKNCEIRRLTNQKKMWRDRYEQLVQDYADYREDEGEAERDYITNLENIIRCLKRQCRRWKDKAKES